MTELKTEGIFIVDAARTAIGKTAKGLKDLTAVELAVETLRGVICRNNVEVGSIDELILGNVVSGGAGQNMARQAACLAGLPVSLPSFTVNSVCGSGLQSIILGIQAILAKDVHLVLALAAESASRTPYLLERNKEEEGRKRDLIDSLVHDGLWCHLTNKHMGELAEVIAREFKVSREDQDRYALASHQKACRAQERRKFPGEIIPVPLKNGDIFEKDERPRKNISLEKLASLPAVFLEDGTVTAGNSSAPADGANCFLVASEEAVKKNRFIPQARILSYASVAVEPNMVFTGAMLAVNRCLKKAGLTLKDIDLFEICEAFAVQALWTRRELKIPEEKMNIWGGDVALGHPLGAAGSRALVTLIHALKDQKKTKGIVSVCFGGGGAIALAVESV